MYLSSRPQRFIADGRAGPCRPDQHHHARSGLVKRWFVKLGRHYWRNPPVALDTGQWERLPDRFGLDPVRHAESAAMLAEVRRVVRDELTEHQRRIFTAIVVDGIPLDALAAKLGLRRHAIYKVIFDARRKIAAVTAAGNGPGPACPASVSSCGAAVSYTGRRSGSRSHRGPWFNSPQLHGPGAHSSGFCPAFVSVGVAGGCRGAFERG
jgi:hypothetical protein